MLQMHINLSLHPAPCIPADEEEQELATLRKLLCLPKEAVADIDTATKGRIFRTAVQSALGAGIDGFTQARRATTLQAPEGCVLLPPSAVSGMRAQTCRRGGRVWLQEDRKAVRQAREAVRLPEHLAKEILKDTTRKCARRGCSGRASASKLSLETEHRPRGTSFLGLYEVGCSCGTSSLGVRCHHRRAFLGFVTRSRNVRNRLDGAKELKKLVYFSNIVVSPLLEDLQVRPLMSPPPLGRCTPVPTPHMCLECQPQCM